MPESYAGKINRKLLKKQRIIAAAAGREPADLVLKNATFVNVFSNELSTMDIAVAEGLIVGMGSYLRSHSSHLQKNRNPSTGFPLQVLQNFLQKFSDYINLRIFHGLHLPYKSHTMWPEWCFQFWMHQYRSVLLHFVLMRARYYPT